MQNKIVRLLFVESYCRKRIVLICAAAIILLIALQVKDRQQKILADLLEKNQLIAQIPALEQELPQSARVASAAPVQAGPMTKKYSLQGISIEPQNRYVVINDEVYREGEGIDNYVVSHVTENDVTLVNLGNRQEEKLYLYASEARIAKRAD